MKRFLALIPLLCATPAAAQDAVRPGKSDPASTAEKRATPDTITQALEGLGAEGFAKKGRVERYTEANLFEKINGRSELFHSYGVSGMAFASFSKGDKFIDVYLYDMATPLGAFGVYSVERQQESKPLAAGDGGHRTGADLFFRKGQYYVSVLTSGTDDDIQKAAFAIAGTLAKRLKGESAPLWGMSVLPSNGRVDESVQYFMVDALGLDFVKDAFMARYRDGGSEFTAFVSRCASAEDATKILAKHRAHLKEFGQVVAPVEIAGKSVTFADMGQGEFDGVCQVGRFIVGVTAVKGREAAVKAMTSLLQGLSVPK